MTAGLSTDSLLMQIILLWFCVEYSLKFVLVNEFAIFCHRRINFGSYDACVSYSDEMTAFDCVQVLTEDNLTSLDELFQLISPTRDGEENFATSLTTAGEHMISLLEGRDRPVAGSTYKELLELIHLIDGCGYFERVRETAEASAGEKVEGCCAGADDDVEVDGPQRPVGQGLGGVLWGQGPDCHSENRGMLVEITDRLTSKWHNLNVFLSRHVS